jgi:hypothetical protein
MAYGLADKQLYVFDAQHFKSRPYHWYEVAGRFVYKKLGIAARPRFYESVYGESQLHIGTADKILRDLMVVQSICNDQGDVDDVDLEEQNHL